MAPTIKSKLSRYRIGDLVNVGPRTRPGPLIAYVLKMEKIEQETDENDTIPSLVDEHKYKVIYPVFGRTSIDVEELRMKPATLQTTHRK